MTGDVFTPRHRLSRINLTSTKYSGVGNRGDNFSMVRMALRLARASVEIGSIGIFIQLQQLATDCVRLLRPISHHMGYISSFGCCSDRCSKYAVSEAIHRPTVPLHLTYGHLQVISGTLLRRVAIALEAPYSTRKQLEPAHEAFAISKLQTSTERNVLRSENGVVVRETHWSLVPWPHH